MCVFIGIYYSRGEEEWGMRSGEWGMRRKAEGGIRKAEGEWGMREAEGSVMQTMSDKR